MLSTVRRYIDEHRLLEPGDRVLVAVSGGPDSLCLLHLLHRLSPALDLKLAVAHLDHRFRPEARDEAAGVCRLAGELGLPYFGGSADVPAYRAARGLSAQAAARAVRYRFLKKAARRFGSSKIALGHHMDDQAETVLFHFLRGTGPDGLAGMLPRRPLGKAVVIRPLLGVTRSQIEEYCSLHSLEPVLDASNLKPVYTRNRLRLELIPHLRDHYNPRVTEALFRLSSLAAADRNYLHRRARQIFRVLARRGAQAVILPVAKLRALPAALRGRVIRLALLSTVPAREAGWEQVKRVLALCSSPYPSGSVQLPGGSLARRSNDRLIMASCRAGEMRVLQSIIPLRIPGKTAVPWIRGWITARLACPAELSWPPPPYRAYLDRDRLPRDLVIRTRWAGARFHPQGLSGSKKLKEFLIDAKIPRERRDLLPLVAAGEEVAWVAGVRIAHPYRVTPETARVLVLELACRPLG